MTTTIQTRYARKSGLVTANLGEELALLDLSSGRYLGFNPTAAHIWQLLETSRTVDDLVVAMVAEFEIDPERCRNEIVSLLDQLTSTGLIVTGKDHVE